MLHFLFIFTTKTVVEITTNWISEQGTVISLHSGGRFCLHHCLPYGTQVNDNLAEQYFVVNYHTIWSFKTLYEKHKIQIYEK